jgi:hypothetical protein
MEEEYPHQGQGEVAFHQEAAASLLGEEEWQREEEGRQMMEL